MSIHKDDALLWDEGAEEVHVELTVGPSTSGPEIKNGSSVKDGSLERLRCQRDNPGELDVRRRCKKNSSSVLSCISKREKEASGDCGNEVGLV